MIMKIRRQLVLLAPVVCAACACVAWAEPPAKKPEQIKGLAAPVLSSAEGKPSVAANVRWTTFDEASGEKYFALSLSPQEALPVAAANDIVVMVDTSATQSGAYRQQSLAVLHSLLESLSEKDRVRLVAVDTRPVPLTSDFVATDSEEMHKALATLQRRAPLGATDLQAALTFAAEAFSDNSPAARSVVYVGDGMNKASFLSGRELNPLAERLTDRYVSVSSCAIGMERNFGLLSAISNLSGGNFVNANPEEQSPAQAGQQLAAIVQTPVAWPTKVTLPETLSEIYPAQLPPLRGDRDTIVIGRMKEAAAATVQVQLQSQGKKLQFTWTATPEKSNPDFAFLPKLVNQAQRDKGATLTTLGSAGLRDAARVVMRSADDLADLGEKALAMGNVEGAKRVAEEALRRDPENPKARALHKLTATSGTVFAPPAGERAEDDLKLVKADDDRDGSLLENFEKKEGAFIGEVETARGVKAGLVKAQVEESLKYTRQMVADGDHATAVQELKRELEKVERTAELEPETRQNLRDRLVSAIREYTRRGTSLDLIRAEAEQRRAAAMESQRLATELRNREQKLVQLMSRFEALIAEKRYIDAETDIMPEIENIAPDSSISQSASLWGTFLKHKQVLLNHSYMKEKQFTDTLLQVELSHIPLPDEPPIIYPSAARWEEITARRKKYKSVDLVKPGSAEAKIVEKLQEEVTIEEPEIELGRLMETIASRKDITIVFDPVGLEEAGVTKDQIVSHNLKGISLRSAFRLILGPLNLTYVIKDEVLQITSKEKASEQLVTKVYPVGDLVLQIPQFQGGGGFGGGTGMGGGGMGGGAGGAGGGGGMMGGGGGAFDVEDDLKLDGRNTAPKPQAATKPQVVKSQVAATPAKLNPAESNNAQARPALPLVGIKLDRSSGESLDASWDRYFAKVAARVEANEKQSVQVLNETDAAVRQTAREMVSSKDFAGMNAMIQSALRNGYGQPWMYEALSIALRAENAPEEEVERALMSGVDLADSLDEVMYLAIYMSKTGLEKSALKLYRQLAALQPSRPEPYVQGLACARHLKDREGLMWACEGILSQAWDKQHRHLEQEALREGKALILAMEKEQKTEDARAFEKRLRAAFVRDCRVKISWTGDADLDMQVEEPSGTICSLNNPRSTAGGVFLGDSFSNGTDTPLEGFQEMYVCPEAFAGEYRMLIKRVWGKVTTGKVTVEVYTHYGTPEEKHIKHQVTIGDKPAMVVFNLDAGRRQEPLADAQIANVAKMQHALGRQILAQQIAGLSNGNNGIGGINGGVGGVGARDSLLGLLGGRGAVGFNIVPTILNEGLQMQSNAVISADRRYVRITPAPSITAIGDVTTFNVQTGATTSTGGGAGGGVGGGGGAGAFGT
jgi:hypothetical protein